MRMTLTAIDYYAAVLVQRGGQFGGLGGDAGFDVAGLTQTG